MPKLAIYVPKKDMRNIERWRKKINFSQVFMRALGEEIKNRSRKVRAEDAKLTAAAQHYQALLQQAVEPLVEFGYQLGTFQVVECRLPADIISELLAVEKRSAKGAKELATIGLAIENDKERIEKFLEEHGYDERSRSTWRESIYKGYLAGVSDAWQKVCEHMQPLQ